ncbi:MAG: hypothetical protein KJZ80_08805 [Hyphomicrobiaceae bacterium]|nr:hypothetical protein [Hyphomicrobiaceae bacterium]
MTRTRWAIVIGSLAVLLALLAWQLVRQRQMASCLASGGVWDGPNSRCVPASPILQRDIYRS